MKQERYNHGCGSININNKQILVVAGGLNSAVDFLDLSAENPMWMEGTSEVLNVSCLLAIITNHNFCCRPRIARFRYGCR